MQVESKAVFNVTRVGNRGDFTYHIPGIGIYQVPKGITWDPVKRRWRLVIRRQFIHAVVVHSVAGHYDALKILVRIWREHFKSNKANPECGYILAHKELGRPVRSNTGIGGVTEIRYGGKVTGFQVSCPHDGSIAYVSVKEFGGYTYALSYADALRDSSMRRHEINLRYKDVLNATC